jgi:plasmid maintenance system antidote protein VapI
MGGSATRREDHDDEESGASGEILREDVLVELGLSVGDAAARLGISRVTLSRVLHGHARADPGTMYR